MLRLLARPDAQVVALGGGAVGSERVREALRAHTVVHLEVDPDDAWRRASGKGRPAGPRPRAASTSCTATARRCTSPSPTPWCPAAAATPPGGRCPRCAPCRPATRLVWASSLSGEYPVFLGRGLVARGFFPPLEGRRFVVTDEHVARHHRVDAEASISVLAGRGAQDHPRSGVRAPPAGPGRRRARRPGRGRRRGRGGRPRRLLRGRLPARHPPRAGADDARRPGRLGLRRQDRRGPAGGQELRRRPSTSPRPWSATRPRSTRCPRPSSPPATPRWSRPP